MNQSYGHGCHSFDNAEKLAMDFEEILQRHDLGASAGSEIERLLLGLVQLNHLHRHPECRVDEPSDPRIMWSELAGIHDLVSKVVRAAIHPRFDRLVPHLALLQDGSPLQNAKTEVTDAANNKIFELYVAALCLAAGASDLDLDDPNLSSGGKNPDVIAIFEGTAWAFACKVLHSHSAQSMFANVVKAIEQIECSPAPSGFVVISAKNILRRDAIWPHYHEGPAAGAHLSYPTVEQPLAALRTQVDSIAHDLGRQYEAHHELGVEQDLRSMRAQPCALIYAPAVTSVVRDYLPHTTHLNGFGVATFRNISSSVFRVVKLLHAELQKSGSDTYGAPP